MEHFNWSIATLHRNSLKNRIWKFWPSTVWELLRFLGNRIFSIIDAWKNYASEKINLSWRVVNFSLNKPKTLKNTYVAKKAWYSIYHLGQNCPSLSHGKALVSWTLSYLVEGRVEATSPKIKKLCSWIYINWDWCSALSL